MRLKDNLQPAAGQRGLKWIRQECVDFELFFHRTDIITAKDRHSFAVGISRISENMNVSKSTAYRAVQWLMNQGYVEIAATTVWRGDARKHWYALTDLAIATFCKELVVE